mgnify:CR=1 FL=1
MAVKNMYFDKTEMVVMVPAGKKIINLNLSYDQISRIQIDPCTEISFFRKVPSEKITIITSKHANPIVFTKCKNKKFYEEYKAGITKFASDNRVTFSNNT